MSISGRHLSGPEAPVVPVAPVAGSTGAAGGGASPTRVSPYEVATGWVTGFDRLAPYPASALAGSARAAFEDAVRAALLRPPCVVAFSGGRDSSAVLAVALHVARRDGLRPPIAATHVFPGAAASDESSWQEMVAAHLAIPEWLRVPANDSFDVLGAGACAGLRRHGLLWPALVHCHGDLLELARGGTLLTGNGGDEVLGDQRITPLVRALHRRPRSLRRLARRAVAVCGPSPVRRELSARRHRRYNAKPWLRPEVWQEHLRDLAADDAAHPLRWDRALRRWPGQRSARVGLGNLQVVARDWDVEYHHPFLDRRFVEGLAREGGVTGYPSRAALMARLFGDLLPAALVARDTKADFTAVAAGDACREFARRWSGGGLDPALVDAEKLRAEWLAPEPHSASMMLLQAAWLADQGVSPQTR